MKKMGYVLWVSQKALKYQSKRVQLTMCFHLIWGSEKLNINIYKELDLNSWVIGYIRHGDIGQPLILPKCISSGVLGGKNVDGGGLECE